MRVGRVESLVPDRELLLDRLDAAQDLDAVKDIVATLITSIGKYAYGYNERTGERVLGLIALGGGGSMFFSNTDERGQVVNQTQQTAVLPQPDRKSEPVTEREEIAKAQRVKVGKN